MTALLKKLVAAEADMLAADEEMPPGRRVESVASPLHTAMFYLEQAIAAAQEHAAKSDCKEVVKC